MNWHVYCYDKLQQFITWLNFKMINNLTIKKRGWEQNIKEIADKVSKGFLTFFPTNNNT